MNIIGHQIDANGFFIGDVLEDSGVQPDVTVICPGGFYRAKWSGIQWEEGLTQAEIDSIRNTPPVKTPEQKEIDKLKADKEESNLKIIELWETLLDAGVL